MLTVQAALLSSVMSTVWMETLVHHTNLHISCYGKAAGEALFQKLFTAVPCLHHLEQSASNLAMSLSANAQQRRFSCPAVNPALFLPTPTQITLMCLLEMVHGLPADSRTIALPSIATATKLSVDGVEFLLMKALSLHLIEGVIDQVRALTETSRHRVDSNWLAHGISC